MPTRPAVHDVLPPSDAPLTFDVSEALVATVASDATSDADDDGVESRAAQVDAALHNARLDKALVTIAGEFSRSHLQSLIEQGHVRLDGVVARSAAQKVKAAQRLTVDLVPPLHSRAFRPEPRPIDVAYEDDDLLVVRKPAGWVVHPAAGNWSGTLLNALLCHHAAAAGLPRAGIVHRLDKDTSGLMVVGKTLPAVTGLVRAIAARDVRRDYLAIAHGRLQTSPLRIDRPIGRDPRTRVRMAVVTSGKPSMTDVMLLGDDGHHSALLCRLHSGRTHQIRVHLASVGHPLVADATYGGRVALGMQRQALHAVRLAFAHPVSGEALAFVAAPPADVASAWGKRHRASSAGIITITTKLMSSLDRKHVLEAALLCAQHALSMSELMAMSGADEADVSESLLELGTDWQGRGLQLVNVASGWRFQSRPELNAALERLHTDKPPRYSRAVLETVMIVALRQPVTRGEIEDIRGVAVAGQIIRQLEERGWVRSCGHKESPGRPALWVTTPLFLSDLGLASLAELPGAADAGPAPSVQLSIGLQPSTAETAAAVNDHR